MRYCMKNFHFKIAFVLFQIVGTAYGQVDSIKINQLVEKLSWGNIIINCGGGILYLTHEDSIENELLEIGQPATEALLKALDNPQKTVIAHIILSRLWEDTIDLGLSGTLYIYKDCTNLIGWHHIYNGIVWEWYSGKSDQIEKSEIEKVKTYWTDKITYGKKVKRFDDLNIFEELKKNDLLKYPCIRKQLNKKRKKSNA
jgi:hypothetical protein